MLVLFRAFSPTRDHLCRLPLGPQTPALPFAPAFLRSRLSRSAATMARPKRSSEPAASDLSPPVAKKRRSTRTADPTASGASPPVLGRTATEPVAETVGGGAGVARGGKVRAGVSGQGVDFFGSSSLCPTTLARGECQEQECTSRAKEGRPSQAGG